MFLGISDSKQFSGWYEVIFNKNILFKVTSLSAKIIFPDLRDTLYNNNSKVLPYDKTAYENDI